MLYRLPAAHACGAPLESRANRPSNPRCGCNDGRGLEAGASFPSSSSHRRLPLCSGTDTDKPKDCRDHTHSRPRAHTRVSLRSTLLEGRGAHATTPAASDGSGPPAPRALQDACPAFSRSGAAHSLWIAREVRIVRVVGVRVRTRAGAACGSVSAALGAGVQYANRRCLAAAVCGSERRLHVIVHIHCSCYRGMGRGASLYELVDMQILNKDMGVTALRSSQREG